MTNNILHVIPGAEGTEAHVIRLNDDRISVKVFDLDAEEYYPGARIWPAGPDAEAKALAHAETIKGETNA